MVSRFWTAISAAALVAGVMAVAPQAVQAEPSVAESGIPIGSEARLDTSKNGTAEVRIGTPAGVPVNVALVRGTLSQTVSKSEAGDAAIGSASLPAAVYRVKPERVVFQGRLYVGKAKPAKVKVRAGRTSRVKVTYKAVAIAGQIQAASITQTSIALTWSAPKKAKVALRRAAGGVPVVSPKQGTKVVVSGNAATDSGLAAGSQYTYSLFTKRNGRWSPPVTFTAGTSAPDGSGVAAYVAASTTTLLTQNGPGARRFSALADGASTGQPTGEGVQVTLDEGIPTPVMGSAMVLPASAALPGGYLGKVVAMTPDGRTITLEAASMTDAFDYYSIDVPDASGPDQELIQDSAAGTSPLSRQGRLTASGLLKCSATADQQVAFNPSIKLGGSFSGKIVKVGPIPKSAALGAKLTVTLTGAASVTSSGELKCSVPFRPVSFMLATTPVPIAFSFTPTIEATASGSVSIQNLGYTATGGVKFDGTLGPDGAKFTGGAVLTAAPLTPTVAANGSIELKVGGEVLVGPGAGTPAAGVMAGVGGYLNPLMASFSPHFQVSDGRFNVCTTSKAKMSAGLNITAKAWLGTWERSRTFTVDGLNREFNYGGPWFLPSGCNNLPVPPTQPPPTQSPPTQSPPTQSPPPPTSPQTWGEQSGSHGSPTFRNPANASDQGATVPAMSWVQVSCKVHPPTTISSANPDGYWYRIASAPWNNEYYAVANTFWNGDVPGQLPYTHNTDWSVPDCP